MFEKTNKIKTIPDLTTRAVKGGIPFFSGRGERIFVRETLSVYYGLYACTEVLCKATYKPTGERLAMKKKIIFTFFGAAFFAVSLFSTVYAGQYQNRMPAGLLAMLLHSAGAEAEKDLQVHQGFVFQTVTFAGPEGEPVTIGVPLGMARNENRMLLIADGERSFVSWSPDTGLEVVSGSGLVSQGVFDVVECILGAVDTMISLLRECDGVTCIVEAALIGSLEISLCPINIL